LAGGDAAVLSWRMPLIGEYEPSTSDRSRQQVELYESSGGTKGNTLYGMPVVIVTSRGARSKKLRKTPLMRVEHDGSYAAVGSQGGAPKHPFWYHNLMAEPHVELQDGPVRRDMRARLAGGAERRAWWDRAVAAFPNYAAYQRKTEREIPLFIIEPVEIAGSPDT
jgi:deazaflavin-dependent oxidoreductase (nitroreductase family)